MHASGGGTPCESSFVKTRQFCHGVLMTSGRDSNASLSGKAQVKGEFFAPPPEFEGCFTSFYHLSLQIEGDGFVIDHLQPEWANLRFFAGSNPTASLGDTTLGGARYTATGPSSEPCKFTLGSCEMWGIGLLPLGWARFIDCSAEQLCNTISDGESHALFEKFAPLTDVLCDASIPRQQQYEAIVAAMREAMRPGRDDDKILTVHNALIDSDITTVAQLSEITDISVRTLERLCRRHFGFAPKLLLRRQRFMRSLTGFMLAQGKNWTDVMDNHYHDQAQFTREFRAFMHMSPSEYAGLEHPILSAFMEARARIWGSAAQTLDKPK